MGNSVLEVKNLRKKFGSFTAIDDISLFILNIVYLTLSIIFFGFILKRVLKSGKLVKVV